jgi:lactate dehydrogenase-like 2-hydroxyacid dehydrogenase
MATGASHTLRGRALGLVGLGNIGQLLAAKLGCAAWGMQIHYYDVERKPAAVESKLQAGFHPTLEELLSAVDVLVLCAPAASDGRAILNREALCHLRPGARIVNVARGSLIDEEALADALDSGSVTAAALDVHHDEPHVNERLRRMAGLDQDPKGGYQHPGRVMLTCHNAGGTVETHIGFEELSMRNIMSVLSGSGPITPVNLAWLKPRVHDDEDHE